MRSILTTAFSVLAVCACVDTAIAATLSGTIIDNATGRATTARIYIHDAAGQFFHVKSVGGEAIPYERRSSKRSVEVHTTISAHPFRASLPPGQYTITVEKGKEYFAESRQFTINDRDDKAISIRLKRWVNMAAEGWFSGETHVHREVAELPLLQLAEDINVAFPLTAWVTDSEETPVTHNKNRSAVSAAKTVHVDQDHVFWPVNTEYEIFTVRGRTHTLGAVFILNHKEQFSLPAPPVAPIAIEARRQGGFLELDKHNWPWSMMLVPQMEVDLFELANNHMWRTEFLFGDWYTEYAPKFMNIEMIDGRFTERGWIDFGFQNYYTLLNCGFKLRPTAGTASGVHPVPFGYGRVYVRIDGEFSYDKWVHGLLAGHSFVTTGPMLTAEITRKDERTAQVRGQLISAAEPTAFEIVVNGRVIAQIPTTGARGDDGVYRIQFSKRFTVDSSSWIAVRAFTKRDDNRVNFAHTAPVHLAVEGKPLRPTRNQRDYLVKRVQDELARHRGVLSPEALNEFEKALQSFEAIEAAE